MNIRLQEAVDLYMAVPENGLFIFVNLNTLIGLPLFFFALKAAPHIVQSLIVLQLFKALQLYFLTSSLPISLQPFVCQGQEGMYYCIHMPYNAFTVLIEGS